MGLCFGWQTSVVVPALTVLGNIARSEYDQLQVWPSFIKSALGFHVCLSL